MLFAIAGGFLFHALQVKYVFLGDCGVRPTEIEKGDVYYPTEFLARYIPYLFFQYFHANHDFTVYQSLYLASNVAGGLFILTALLTADVAGKTFLQKAAFFLVSTLSLAALMQFCGYSEIYAFPLVSIGLYLFLCLLHLKGKISIIFPFLGWAFAMANHFIAACLLPSLLFLFYRSVLWKYPLFRRRNTFITLGIIGFVILIYGLNRFGGMMYPMTSGENGLMTMFSIAHFKEFVNYQLLGGGLIFLIWLAVLIFAFVKKVHLSSADWFWVIASVSVTAFIFVFDMWRGSGDWDIASFSAVVFCPATAFILLSLHNDKIISNLKYGICVLSVFGIMHSGVWILTNHTDKSISWVEKAFLTDPGSYYRNSFSNESMLGAIFSSNNLKEKSLYWERQAYLNHPNDNRTGYNYAYALIQAGKTDEAIKIYEQSLIKFPDYALPYAQLITIYYNNKNYAALYAVLIKMENVYRQNPEVFTSRLTKEQIDSYFDILNQLKSQMQ